MKPDKNTSANDLLHNLLRNQVMIAEHYNRFVSQCMEDKLRDDVICLLHEEHDIGGKLLSQLQERGLLNNTSASKESVEAVKKEAGTLS